MTTTRPLSEVIAVGEPGGGDGLRLVTLTLSTSPRLTHAGDVAGRTLFCFITPDGLQSPTLRG